MGLQKVAKIQKKEVT